jgi:hypothetical protein
MDTNKDLTPEQKLGLEIETELNTLLASGQSEFSIEEIEAKAPKTYDVLYEVCEEDDEENGIETSNFKLMEVRNEEKEESTFKLSKK